jgi:hypothetical protein
MPLSDSSQQRQRNALLLLLLLLVVIDVVRERIIYFDCLISEFWVILLQTKNLLDAALTHDMT